MADALPDFAVNLRRLLNWHHATMGEAAQVLGASRNSLSGWLNGKWEPNAKYLIRLEEVYGVSPGRLRGDPIEFGQLVADPERVKRTEENLARSRASA